MRYSKFFAFFLAILSAPVFSFEYHFAFFPSDDKDYSQVCEKSRKFFGKAVVQHFRLEGALTSCVPYPRQPINQMAFVFAFDDELEKPLPDLELLRLGPHSIYTAMVKVKETRARTRLKWNGSQWLEREESYVVETGVHETRVAVINDEQSCRELQSTIETNKPDLPLFASVFASQCVYDQNADEWSLYLITESGNSSQDPVCSGCEQNNP